MGVNKIRLNRAKFSRIVWENIFSYAEPHLNREREFLQNKIIANEKWRQYAEYNTGSMSLDAMYVLYALSKFLKPQVAAEVGTFIGNSASAIIMGYNMVELHTCDHSNNIFIFEDRDKIKQYRKKSSTDMFKALLDENKKLDLVFVDGRLAQGDIPMLEQLSKDTTVFALDDFEGVEKGVANASVLLAHPWIRPYYHLVYPPKELDCSIALLLPRTLVEWTDQ